MSVKNNQYLAASAAALGLVLAAGVLPIAEGVLNDVPVHGMHAAEISDGSGKVAVFVTVADAADPAVQVVRPVADAAGNVRLFGDGSAVVALSKRSNLVPGAAVRFVRFNKAASVGDPIVSLKAKFKKMKGETAAATAKGVELSAKLSAAESLGWDGAVGSPEFTEYQDIAARVATIAEWEAVTTAIRVQLAAALTAAGIDPATVV